MRVALVNVEDGIASNGFRRMASHVKSYHPETTSCYVIPDQNALWERAFPSGPSRSRTDFADQVAESLSGWDLVGFSSVTMRAPTVEAIIARLRAKSPETYIVWGGSHGIMAPEAAIEHADAVCTGEGERPFQILLESLRDGRDHFHAPNFWLRRGESVVKNSFDPLLSSAELNDLPPPEYADPDEAIFETNSGFVPMRRRHYLRYNGLSYRTIWSIGCPFHCTYCGNTKFIANDPGYRKIRHSEVDTLMRELRNVVTRHPHVRSMIFEDDSFMALKTEVIEEFCEAYREEIGIPFTVTGVIPNYVQQRKLDLLVRAGLVRIRMGIQSGSDRILDFYKRPSPRKKVMEAAEVIHRFQPHMMPPDYDIIADNPIETEEDVRDTLQLIYDLPRPFHLNLFSLTIMPNTELECQFDDLAVGLKDAIQSYRRLAPTLANATLYLLCLVKPPRWMMKRILERAKPSHLPQPEYPLSHKILRTLWTLRRSWHHFRFMGFINYPGALAYSLYRSGLVATRQRARAIWSRRLFAKTPKTVADTVAAADGT
ncbi:MAG: B12-binding domain-containing radical SAM protein [Thermoanaerobaculia bacterium]|nr:B12-binding domain-containing radical SAM protein [Thermoanaerobaculia bacterium]